VKFSTADYRFLQKIKKQPVATNWAKLFQSQEPDEGPNRAHVGRNFRFFDPEIACFVESMGKSGPKWTSVCYMCFYVNPLPSCSLICKRLLFSLFLLSRNVSVTVSGLL